MTNPNDTRALVEAVHASAEPIKMACIVIGVMAGVISHHKGDQAASQFLRAAAEKLETKP